MALFQNLLAASMLLARIHYALAGTVIPVQWGHNNTLTPIAVRSDDELVFSWNGDDSVAYILGVLEDVKCVDGKPTEVTVLGWAPPLSVDLSALPTRPDHVTFLSSSQGKCRGEALPVWISQTEQSQDMSSAGSVSDETLGSHSTEMSGESQRETKTASEIESKTNTEQESESKIGTDISSQSIKEHIRTVVVTETRKEAQPTETSEEDTEIGTETVEQARWHYGVVIGLLLITQLLSYFIHRLDLHFISDAVATICVGGVASAFFALVSNAKIVAFDPSLFFFVLLPCIVFESGYTFHKRSFFCNFGSILMYAIVGCLVSTLVTGLLMYTVVRLPFVSQEEPWSLSESLIFGSLISSTDPVATLAVFSSMKADQTLYGLVFGESVMNDAVSILLYRVFSSFDESSFKSSSIPVAIWMFFGVFIGSLAFGLLTSMALALVLKYSQVRQTPSMEVMLLMLVGYCCYVLADIVSLSGIVAIFFYGCGCRHYVWYNLSQSSTAGSLLFFRVVADASETFVLLYLGLSIFPLGQHYWPGYIFCGIAASLIGRAANIFPLSAIINCFRKQPVPFRMQLMLCHAGLKGAVAYALAMDKDVDGSRGIRTTTQMIVLFTVVVLGGTSAPLLKKLKLTEDSDKSLPSVDNDIGYESVAAYEPEFDGPVYDSHGLPVTRSGRKWGEKPLERPSKRSVVANALNVFDHRYIVPFITRRHWSQVSDTNLAKDHSCRSIAASFNNGTETLAGQEGGSGGSGEDEDMLVDMGSMASTRLREEAAAHNHRWLQMGGEADEGLLSPRGPV